MSFFNLLILVKLEAYLRACQTYMIESFGKNSLRPKAVTGTVMQIVE